jgi:hypothetical protein
MIHLPKRGAEGAFAVALNLFWQRWDKRRGFCLQ